MESQKESKTDNPWQLIMYVGKVFNNCSIKE